MSFTFKTISPSTDIGDSLIYINANYRNLSLWANTLQYDAIQYWKPLLEYYAAHKNEFLSAYTTSVQNSAKWVSMVSLVKTNSAKWIEPITIFYPEIFYFPTSQDNLLTVTQWVTSNFPVLSGGIPLYVENQQLIVHNYSNNINVSYNPAPVVYHVEDTTSCSTYDSYICAYCTTYFSGYVYCSNGDFNCDGQSTDCSQCKTVHCAYGYPYINVGPNQNSATGKIAADVSFKFHETKESYSVNAYSFKVKNCAWTFDKTLPYKQTI